MCRRGLIYSAPSWAPQTHPPTFSPLPSLHPLLAVTRQRWLERQAHQRQRQTARARCLFLPFFSLYLSLSIFPCLSHLLVHYTVLIAAESYCAWWWCGGVLVRNPSRCLLTLHAHIHTMPCEQRQEDILFSYFTHFFLDWREVILTMNDMIYTTQVSINSERGPLNFQINSSERAQLHCSGVRDWVEQR